MKTLLTEDTFDSFLLHEAELKVAYTLKLDGRVNASFYAAEDAEENEYIRYGGARPLLFDAIKGKRTPLFFKFTLMEKGDNYHMMNITFNGETIVITTAVAYKEFTLEKEEEEQWDERVALLLEDKNFAYEIL